MESVIKGKRERYCEKKDIISIPILKCTKDIYNDKELQFLDKPSEQCCDRIEKVTNFDYKKFLEKHLHQEPEDMHTES